MEKELQKLKLQKVQLLDQMSMLSSISESFYTQLGKLEAKIIILQKKILQETKNDLDQD